MADDFDMVSDLNGTGDTTVAVHENDSAHGSDAVAVNNRTPRATPAAPVEPAKKIAAEPAPADKPLSLRDQISSALKGEGDTPAAASQDGLVRDPLTGKFMPKPAADPLAADPATGDPAAEAARPVAAPAGIDAEVFKSLPAETQASLARTMDGIAQSQQRFASLEPIEQLIAPRVQAWAMNGMQPAQAMSQLLALSDFAGRDPGGFIKYIAQNNGVNLEDLVLGMDPAEQVDPGIAALQKEVAELRGAREADIQQQKQAAHEQTVNRVVAFASEKDQGGKPLRPYFEELGQGVMPFISAVKAENPDWPHDKVLQEAYDRACWGTPSVRSKMQAAADAVRDAERLRQGADKVDRARAASVGVKPGAPTTAPTPPNDASRSLRDTIRASIAASA